MTATSAFFTLFGSSILRNSHNLSQLRQLRFNNLVLPTSPRLNCYSSSAALLDSDITNTTGASPAITTHPWPEWVTFVNRLKAKGYLMQKSAVSDSGGSNYKGVVDYMDMDLLKDSCLSFARDRYDIFKSLSTQDIQTLVNKGCPNLFRKAVNSAKRLRAYLELDEGDVCSSCNLRGSCDRAYILLNEPETSPRTVDIVRILILYALDPLVISGEHKFPGRDLIEVSARKLLSELIELSEIPPNPDLPKPSSMTSQQKKKSSLSDNSRNLDTKLGNRVCNKEDAARGRVSDVEMKRGDWLCTECSFMNFARNVRCLKCKAEGPKRVSGDNSEMKKGDWNCPGCTFVNFASNKQCLRCQEPRPPRNLRPGDWECPSCDFLNFSGNNSCKKCNYEPPRQEYMRQNDEQTWKKPGDWECPSCDFLNFSRNNSCKKCNHEQPHQEYMTKKDEQTWKKPGDWECPSCDFLNFSRNNSCKKCNHERPRQEYMMQNDEQTWKKPY